MAQVFPNFMDILLGMLNRDCMFTVPRYAAKIAGQSDVEFMRAQGYRPAGDDPNQLESEEEFTVRMQGMYIQTLTRTVTRCIPLMRSLCARKAIGL